MENMLSEEMYRENILELFRNPLNFGSLPNATHTHREYNPLCGDDLSIQLIIKDDKVEHVKFHGKGCAISIAAASMLTDKIKGMAVSQVRTLQKEDILNMLQIPLSPVRLKCALLSLEVLQKAV